MPKKKPTLSPRIIEFWLSRSFLAFLYPLHALIFLFGGVEWCAHDSWQVTSLCKNFCRLFQNCDFVISDHHSSWNPMCRKFSEAQYLLSFWMNIFDTSITDAKATICAWFATLHDLARINCIKPSLLTVKQ